MAQPPGPDDDGQRPESTPPSPWEIDPLSPPRIPAAEGARDTTASTGLTPARRALISVYAGLDDDLREALLKVDPSLAAQAGTETANLNQAASNADASGGRPAIHPLQLAFATMALLGAPPGPNDIRLPRDRESLTTVLWYLHTGETHPPMPVPPPPGAPPGDSGGDGGSGDGGGDELAKLDTLHRALLTAVQPEVPPHERWTTLWREAGDTLSDELKRIKVAWCDSDLVEVGNGIASRVVARLVIDSGGGPTLDEMAAAVVPGNWSHCNDFFCSLTRRDDLDADCVPPATGGEFTPQTMSWRGVYQEKVGGCPDGWFPDTYLLFTWLRSDTQIVLRYQLAPRGLRKRGVLDIDEGFLQVDAFEDRYEVSTMKYLLFDEDYIAGGGQTLGRAACQLGWLDYSINQFTACARDLAGGLEAQAAEAEQAKPGGDINNGGNRESSGFLTREIAAALKRCEHNIAESAEDTNRQLGQIVSRVRASDYDLQAAAADLGQAVARGVRDGARSIVDQQDLLTAYIDLVGGLTRRPGPGGGRR